jgi:large subunit ribosomal protein L29
VSADENKLAAKALREHSNEELLALEKRLREDLFKHKMARHTNQLEDTMRIRKTRRDIARVKTILSLRTAGREEQRAGGAED